MAELQFEGIWNQIIELNGQQFRLIRGDPFTYEVIGNSLIPSRAKQTISRSDFEKAFTMVPISGPGKIRDLVRGSSYVWAVLHDERVSRGLW